MKLNSKRSETESGTQPRGIRDQNDLNLERNYAAYATKMIRYRLET